MARDWESWFQTASGPASTTEEADRDRTERQVREAIAADPRLTGGVRVFAKGSYKNGTNVRRDSDVDIAVMWNRWAYLDRVNDAVDLSWDALGVTLNDGAQPPSPAQLREWVTEALMQRFGAATVDTSGNKAITVAGSSTRLDADVVPCFEYQRYESPHSRANGIALYPKNGGDWIINFPDQNYINGVQKNSATQRRYKQIVRALKRLENDMVDSRRLSAPVHGYFLECLLYNLDDRVFNVGGLKASTQSALATLWSEIDEGRHDDWVELNGCKWLWRGGQTWTADEAKRFAYAAWNFIEGNT